MSNELKALMFFHNRKKGKVILITGRGGPHIFYTIGSHGGEVVSLTSRPAALYSQ
jgi:hypothetical protein